jgi:hypothetical protein
VKEVVVALGADEGVVRTRIEEIRRERRPKPKAPLTDAANAAPIEPAPEPTMDRREIGVVQFIVARPGQASAALADVFPAATVRHPRLRRIVEAAYDLYKARGAETTTDELRETLNQPALDALVFDLAAAAPTDEAFAVGLAELQRTLAAERRRTDSMDKRRLVAEQDGDDDDHLEWVRRGSRP